MVDDYCATVEAFNTVVRNEVLDAEKLALLLTHARHRSSIVRDESADLLGRLADMYAPARESIAEMHGFSRMDSMETANTDDK